MSGRSLADIEKSGDIMVTALRNHREAMAKRGIDDAYIDEFDRDVKQLREDDKLQEAMKAQLITQGVTVNDTKDRVLNRLSETRKLVKLTIDKSGWKEFDIGGSR